MRGVRIDRLSLDRGDLIFSLVKRGDTSITESERTATVNKVTYRHPTPAQLYALELRARRARSQEQVRLVRVAVSAVKSLFARAFSRAIDIQRQVTHHA
jgi:hypothetical protein